MPPITTLEEFRRKYNETRFMLLYYFPIPQKLVRNPLNPHSLNLIHPWSLMQEILDMATKKPGKKRTPFGNVEFVNYKLDAETKARFDTWFNSKGSTVVDAIFETLQGEHKLSVSWDDANECFIASMTGKEDSLNKNKCITIRSAEWFRAQACCAFIHTVIFEGEIWDVSAETDMV